MKQTLTILTCTAALIGAITITQVSTSVTGSATELELELREAHRTADSASESRRDTAATRAQRAQTDDLDLVRDRLAPRSRPQQITPELIDQTLTVAHEIDPELGDRLKAICGEDPNEFERVLRTTGRRLIGLAELREQAPELYDMKRREWRQEVLINRTVRQLAEARAEDDSLRVRMLEDELRGHISIQVALQIAVRGDYLRRLREEMKALERDIDRQASQFEQTVEQLFQATLEQIELQTQRNRGGDDVEFINLRD